MLPLRSVLHRHIKVIALLVVDTEQNDFRCSHVASKINRGLDGTILPVNPVHRAVAWFIRPYYFIICGSSTKLDAFNESALSDDGLRGSRRFEEVCEVT